MRIRAYICRDEDGLPKAVIVKYPGQKPVVVWRREEETSVREPTFFKRILVMSASPEFSTIVLAIGTSVLTFF